MMKKRFRLKIMKRKRCKIGAFACAIVLLAALFTVSARADEAISLPEQYEGFLESLDGSVSDRLTGGATSDNADSLHNAAQDLTSPVTVLSIILEAFN